VDAHPRDDDAVERCIGLPVAAAVQPVTIGSPARRRDWTGLAEFSERAFRMNALGIVAREEQEFDGGRVGDAGRRCELRRGGENEGGRRSLGGARASVARSP
jgi:hypothetical protein